MRPWNEKREGGKTFAPFRDMDLVKLKLNYSSSNSPSGRNPRLMPVDPQTEDIQRRHMLVD
jgi:hypothetical protein